ncbi:MAG: cytochrome c [Acidobacteriota bacterium]
MKSLKLALIPFALALVAGACGTAENVNTNGTAIAEKPAAPAATPGDELVAARSNFKKNCEVCHGEKGTGGLVEIDKKKLKVPNLREGHAVGHSDDKLAKQISEGSDEMPAFKDKLKPEEIKDLVRFLRKDLQGK